MPVDTVKHLLRRVLRFPSQVDESFWYFQFLSDPLGGVSWSFGSTWSLYVTPGPLDFQGCSFMQGTLMCFVEGFVKPRHFHTHARQPRRPGRLLEGTTLVSSLGQREGGHERCPIVQSRPAVVSVFQWGGSSSPPGRSCCQWSGVCWCSHSS